MTLPPMAALARCDEINELDAIDEDEFDENDVVISLAPSLSSPSRLRSRVAGGADNNNSSSTSTCKQSVQLQQAARHSSDSVQSTSGVPNGSNAESSPATPTAPRTVRRFFSTGNLLSKLRGDPSSPTLKQHQTTRRPRFTSEGQPSGSSKGVEVPRITTVAGFDSHNHPLTDAHLPKKVRRYYQRQSDLLKNYEADQAVVTEFNAKRRLSQKASVVAPSEASTTTPMDTQKLLSDDGGLVVTFVDDEKTAKEAEPMIRQPDQEKNKSTIPDNKSGSRVHRKAHLMAQVSLAANVVLLALKLAATIMTGSYAIISSLVDSCVDLTSGLVIWLTNRAIEKRDPYLYPRGRTRLEPLALVIISVVMAVASVQVIVQSTEAMISGSVKPVVEWLPISFMALTIVVKFILFVFCTRYNEHPSVAVLAQDHRNDCISNSVAITCAILGFHVWPYIDPIGAILVSLYIIGTWFSTGYGQIKMLSGRTADAEFINRILKICLEHDPCIKCIDTVLVYHFGIKFLVEVHIVLDENMNIRQAHDIQEPLQNKIECLDYVERAFVHVDYESDHRPEDEHKIV